MQNESYMRTRSILARLILAGAVATSVGACRLHGSAWVSTPGVIIVDETPPPPRHEVIVVRSGYVWVGGHWERSGSQWVWRDGYHERTRADHDWKPGRWERRGKGHAWVAGSWQARGQARGHDHDKPKGRDRVQDHR